MATKLVFTYENIRQIQIKEMKSSGLTRLEPTFYEDFLTHLHRLEEQYGKMAGTNDHNQTEFVLLSEEIRKLRSLLTTLYERRERKIIFLAQVEARGGKPNIKNLTNLELSLYEKMVEVLKRTRSKLIIPDETSAVSQPRLDSETSEVRSMDGEKDNNEMAGEPSDSLTPSGSQPTGGKTSGPSKSDKKSERDLILVQVLQDVEPFQDEKNRKYHPKKEDILHLPAMYAQILVKRGAARIIEDNI